MTQSSTALYMRPMRDPRGSRGAIGCPDQGSREQGQMLPKPEARQVLTSPQLSSRVLRCFGVMDVTVISSVTPRRTFTLSWHSLYMAFT
mmetsp:Transcript_20829/g.49661  ORF Transcript_20829/g.49661 Transcript_20829/m.49661 type:complete len:89 (-) Transcript_20829:1374-1640(-)